jgi:F420-non-reducing hydrogenase small subunit
MSDNGNPTKPKLAIYWAASCGGCEISILAIDEKILEAAEAFDIIMCPCIMDTKAHDIEAMDDKSIDVCLFNGAIRNSEQEYMARLLRQKSKALVAFGSCAQEGGIPGLGNVTNRDEIFHTAYKDSVSTENPDDVYPVPHTELNGCDLHLPVFYDTVRTLDQTVEVDYFLPGCPPEADWIWKALTAIASGQLPAPGSVIGEATTVCDFCPRTRSEKKIREFKRTWEVEPDPDTCLLEQGILCCGIATRGGCGALCPTVGSPCIGCYGPNEGVEDFGARMMAGLASVIDSDDPDEIQRIVEEGIPDPIGSFYRFSLPSSLLRRAKKPTAAAATQPARAAEAMAT